MEHIAAPTVWLFGLTQVSAYRTRRDSGKGNYR